MPQLDAQAWSHLWLLLLIVPAQYLVVLYNGSTESQRATTLHGYVIMWALVLFCHTSHSQYMVYNISLPSILTDYKHVAL